MQFDKLQPKYVYEDSQSNLKQVESLKKTGSNYGTFNKTTNTET